MHHIINVHVLQVYFLWICPSHRSFEWFVDVLRDVERKDITNVLEMHIFITQFFHKFDLRTTMLVNADSTYFSAIFSILRTIAEVFEMLELTVFFYYL